MEFSGDVCYNFKEMLELARYQVSVFVHVTVSAAGVTDFNPVKYPVDYILGGSV